MISENNHLPPRVYAEKWKACAPGMKFIQELPKDETLAHLWDTVENPHWLIWALTGGEYDNVEMIVKRKMFDFCVTCLWDARELLKKDQRVWAAFNIFYGVNLILDGPTMFNQGNLKIIREGIRAAVKELSKTDTKAAWAARGVGRLAAWNDRSEDSKTKHGPDYCRIGQGVLRCVERSQDDPTEHRKRRADLIRSLIPNFAREESKP